MRYLGMLRQIHERLRPEVYLEIGVQHGVSLACALPGTRLIGIDPDPKPIEHDVERSLDFYEMTSDEFFAKHEPAYDLALIDGMHLFEFALRDFMNLERLARNGSTILVHDCIPINAVATSRDRTTRQWTGDVWKLIPILREYRPDLDLTVIDVKPSGLGFVTRLDPESTVLPDAYDQITERFLPLEYADALEYDFDPVAPDVVLARL
jgi:predicted O-methyltransferase YrrM